MNTQVDIPRDNLPVALMKLIRLINGSMRTEQIFVVVNNDFWWRLYWNPCSQEWQVAKYIAPEQGLFFKENLPSATGNPPNGWQPIQCMSTNKLLSLIPGHAEIIRGAAGFEHKNIQGLTVYRPAESNPLETQRYTQAQTTANPGTNQFIS